LPGCECTSGSSTHAGSGRAPASRPTISSRSLASTIAKARSSVGITTGARPKRATRSLAPGARLALDAEALRSLSGARAPPRTLTSETTFSAGCPSQ
jgi:hypothetical protein